MKKTLLIALGIAVAGIMAYKLIDNRNFKSKYDSETAAAKSIDEEADSIVRAKIKEFRFDTAGLSVAPVLILKARMVEKEYSTYKDIALTYKNVSGKKIEAIRFAWYGENAFGEPADMGIGHDGFGGGFTDDPLKPGKTESGTWSILSRDGKKVILAWPTEVVFEDNTKWMVGIQK